MTYDQEFLDKIRPLFPFGFMKQIVDEVNKGRRKKVPRQTIVDALTVYRKQTGKPKNGNGSIDRDEVIRLAVQRLNERGIVIY